MYALHTTLTGLLAAAEAEQEIYLRAQTLSKSLHGIPTSCTTSLVVTRRGSDGLLHAGAIQVEQTSVFGPDQQALQTTMHHRRDKARALLAQYLVQQGHIVRDGILLEPGLRDDLVGEAMDHDLWAWERPDQGNSQDAHTRRLVPRQLPPKAER